MRAAPAHPDIYDCGGALPVPNGYPSAFAPVEYRFALFPNTLYDPSHPEAKSLRAQAFDRKREEFVEQCASQARRLQASGDMKAAAADNLTTVRDPALTAKTPTPTTITHTRKDSSVGKTR